VLVKLITFTHENKNSDEARKKRRRNRKNESESYDVAAYIGTLSFLWDMPYRWVRILVGGIFTGDTLFQIFQILIGKFVMELTPPTVQVLVFLLPIGKVGWKLSTLSVFCLRIGQNLKGVVKEKGDD